MILCALHLSMTFKNPMREGIEEEDDNEDENYIGTDLEKLNKT